MENIFMYNKMKEISIIPRIGQNIPSKKSLASLIDKLEGIQDFQMREYLGIPLTDEQKKAQEESRERSKVILEWISKETKKQIEDYQNTIVDRLKKSILVGGKAYFYRSCGHILLGIAEDLHRFIELTNSCGVNSLIVFTRPDESVISNDDPLTP